MSNHTGQLGSPSEVPFQARRLGRGRVIRPGEFLAENSPAAWASRLPRIAQFPQPWLVFEGADRAVQAR